MNQALAHESVAEMNEAHFPTPTGYRLLIALPKVEDLTSGGIALAAETIHSKEVGTITGYVLKAGPDAYKSKEFFPSGPYCKEGDWIVMRAYSGTRISIDDQEYRIINDASVEGVVKDPSRIVKL